MTELVKYEAARKALAEAVAVDEVQEIRSQAEAMRIYARQASDRDLEVQASQIRFRAERRLGELIILQKETIGLNAGSRGQLKGRDDSGGAVSEQPEDARPTLAETGIDRKLSSRAQKVAAMDAADFEQALERHAQEVRAGQGRVAMDLLKIGAEERGRAHRRNLAGALAEASADLPAGKVFPAAYIDCPWERKGGIGDRAYENHYPTMTWSAILAYLRNARKSLQPNSWAFFWIPRAHLLALVEVETEVEISATGEVTLAKVMMPLGWAVGHALGMDSYSTCFVWTKTDADHPDVSGSGLIAWDQDELLLLFKRGQGLPKPSGAEKFGSNHRERATDHSRKPEHYRRMIAEMVGCDADGQPLPVLEMFARVDAEHPLPPNWEACGNQASPSRSDVAITTDAAPVVAPANEFDALLAISGARGIRLPAAALVVQQYVDRGLAFFNDLKKKDDWNLTEAGWKLLYRLDAERKAQGLAQELAERPQPVAAAASPPAPLDATHPEKGIVDQPGDIAGPGAAVLPAERPGSNSSAEPAFPPTEYADLLAIVNDEADALADRLPEYARRGLATDALGRWRLTGAGKIRLAVIERERAEREALFKQHLDETEFWDWRDLAALAGGEHLDRASVRSLVGLDLAGCSDDLVFLTDAGRARLAELEAIVDRARPAPVKLAVEPRQIDIEELLGPPGRDPLDIPAFLRRAPA
ncbi:MAG: hypothetical protein J0H42_04325 [Rhizobiales bacterium]|nr:hypothetical protein [Hyphomicrobiales bacterium]